MLKIVNKNIKINNHIFDYELENGVLLHNTDWNGEIYHIGNTEYKPIYNFEVNNIDIDKLVENTEQWYKATEIIGFDEL